MILQLIGCLLFESSEIIVPVDVNDTGIATVDTANDNDTDTNDTDTNDTGSTTETDDSDTDTQDTEETDTQDTNDTDTGTDCVPETEVCDGIDNDCDGLLDDGEMDHDGDGYISCTFDANIWVGDSNVVGGNDCDDTDGTVYPSATELCDGLDNDCDSILPVDETDADGDSYVECTIDTNGWDGDSFVIGGNDCSDSNAAVHAILPYYLDSDGDGFGSPDFEAIVCEPSSGYILDNTDCNDGNATIYPNASEVCDGLDNDCNLSLPVDETDNDGDGYVECTIDTIGWSGDSNVIGGEDCDDTNANEFPGQAWYADWDGDGFGNSSNVQINCSQLYATTLDSTDCDDTDNTVHPNATELCDGQVNACGSSMPSEEHDGDGDGFVECVIDANGWDGYGNIQGDDCDDSNSSINPDTEWYADTDSDGFGDASNTLTQCIQPNGFIADNTDCDDTDALSNPNGTEIASDGIDQDCDGVDLTEITMMDVLPGDLLITEVMYFGYSGENDDWVEVYNNSGVDINLQGLEFYTSSNMFTVTSNTVISADEFVVFLQNSGSSNGNFPSNQTETFITNMLVNNTGDALSLEYMGIQIASLDVPNRNDLGISRGTSWVISEYDAPQNDEANWCFSTSFAYQNRNDVYISTPGMTNDSCDQDGDGEYYWDCDDTNPLLTSLDNDGDGFSTCDGDCDDGDASLNLNDADGDSLSTCNGDCDDNDVTIGNIDNDQDGFSACTTDCDDNDLNVYTGAVDYLNDGIDQDCDGVDATGLTAADLVAGDLVITEVQNKTSIYPNNNEREWYEFFNTTGQLIDLSGITLESNSGAHTISNPLFMQPNEYLVVGNTADPSQNGNIQVDIETGQNLGSEEDWISIGYYNGFSTDIIAEIMYLEEDNWDSTYVSKIVYDASILQNNDTSLWCQSTSTYHTYQYFGYTINYLGTPGTPNDSCDYDLDGQFIGDCDNEDPAIYTGAAYLDNPQECMEDQDADGWGTSNASGSAVNGNDCNDNYAELNHTDADGDGLTTCDGDCDDNNTGMGPIDMDGDGQSGCGTEWSLDCDDTDPTTFTGAAYNQSGDVCRKDSDGDGYGDNNPQAGVTAGNDCDDDDPNVYPGKPESPNGIDDDCDGIVDEGTVYYDDDGDGYTENQGDCKDNNSNAYPGAAANDSTTACMEDADGDGYGDNNPPLYVTAGTDCKDSNANAYPGAASIESATACMEDADGDGYGDDSPPIYVTAGIDCNDANPLINPGQPETANDGIDQDCDGLDDTGLQTAQ